MKVEKIKESNGEVELRIEATPVEIDKAFEDGLDVFVTQFDLASLEGETALEKIQKALSPEEARDAISSAVIGYLIPFALDDQNIIPMTSSEVNAESNPVKGESFTFSMTVLPKPEFELSDYSPVEVTVPALTPVTEDDIERQIAMLAHQFALVKVNPETGEEEMEVPEVTEAWVQENLQGMGVGSLQELRDQFKATSERVKQEQFEQSKMAAVMEAYAARFDGEVSDKMVDSMTNEMFEAFKAQLAEENMTLMDFMLQQKTDEKQIRASLALQAKNQLIQGFILDAVFRHEGLKLELSDIMATVRSMAPGNEEEAFDNLQKMGRLFLLKEGASRMKAAEWVLDNATINTVD